MWVRGLKQRINEIITNNCTSHPMWVRGLKLLIVIMSTAN